jgi:hypothetical protein
VSVFHSVGLWVVIGIVAFSWLWRLVIRRYARKRGWRSSRGVKINYGSGDVTYNPDLGNSHRTPDGGGHHGHHHGGGGFFGGGHHGGGGGDSGGGGHHH